MMDDQKLKIELFEEENKQKQSDPSDPAAAKPAKKSAAPKKAPAKKKKDDDGEAPGAEPEVVKPPEPTEKEKLTMKYKARINKLKLDI